MPDFDKNLQPIIRRGSEIAPSEGRIPGPRTVDPSYTGLKEYDEINLSGAEDVLEKLNRLTREANFSEKGVFVTNATLDANRRYNVFNPTLEDNEDFAAYGQSTLSKATNGVLKGLNLAATTVAGGFGMLGGAAIAALSTHKLSSIWDNKFMRELDEWNKRVDNEYLPNYASAREREAKWYSTDNWFTANFLFDKLIKNSGFAVGAMVSGNIANAALLGIGKGLGVLAGSLSAASKTSQAFKVFTPLLRNASRAFSAGKNIEAAAILEKEISSIADVVKASSELAKIATTTDKFARFGDATRRAAVAAYSSAGESTFETIQATSEYRDRLIQEYRDAHGGQDPVGTDLKDIDDSTSRLGKSVFLAGMALLSITEYAQLPYLMGSTYKNSRKASNAVLGKVDDVILKDGKYVTSPRVPGKFGKLYEKAGVVKYVFDPKESFQEIGQYALQVGSQNYFNKARETNAADLWVDGFLYGFIGKDEKGEGVGAFVSKEGMEGGLLGGITGGLIQGIGKYKENKFVKSNTQNFINKLNGSPQFKEAFRDRLLSANRGIVLQQQEQDAVINGDELEAKDLKSDAIHNYLAPRIKYGKFDMIMDDINDLMKLSSTEEGLAEIKQQGFANINDSIQDYHERLRKIGDFAQTINSLYDSMYMRYAGEPLRDEDGKIIENSDKKPVRKYSSDVIDDMVYASTKIYDYDMRIPSVSGRLINAGIDVSGILSSIIENNKPNKEATAEVIQKINELNVSSDIKSDLKRDLRDVIELSLRRKLFLDELDDMRISPLNYQIDWNTYFEGTTGSKVDVSQKVDGKKETKSLDLGKQYSLDAVTRKEGSSLILSPKLTVLSKTLGGEYEVVLPNGKKAFLSPEEFSKYEITDADNTSEKMAEIMDKTIDDVLSRPEYKDIEKSPVTNKLAYVNSLDNQALINDIEKEFNIRIEDIIKEEEEKRKRSEKIKKGKDNINKDQDEIEKDSGTPGEPPTDNDYTGLYNEGKLKHYKILFTSTTTESEGSSDIRYRDQDSTKSAPHIKRSRIFLNNAKNLKGKDGKPLRNKLRGIIVTPNQLQSLGLTGLVQMSFEVEADRKIEDIPGALYKRSTNDIDYDHAFMAAVFVEQDGRDMYFIDEKGERISKVDGTQTDLNRVIFQTMPTTELEYGKGGTRYRTTQKDEATVQSKAWSKKRKELFDAPAKNWKENVYKFSISRGIPREYITDKIREKNHIGGVLAPEEIIKKQRGLIKVSTTGSIFHDSATGGENIPIRKGLTVLVHDDTFQILSNNTLGQKKAKAVYSVIKAIAKDLENGKPINSSYASFLKKVLYWKRDKAKKDNQIFVNSDNATISIGGTEYNITDIVNKEKEIVDNLKNAYHNTNNEFLDDKKFDEEFIEYDENLVPTTWTNYQTYLLSSRDTKGNPRSIEDTPLTTSVAKPTEAVPTSFMQKYAAFSGFELITIPEKKPENVPPPPPPPSSSTPITIGSYTLNTDVPQVFKAKLGDVNFTAVHNEDTNTVKVNIIQNETINKYVNSEADFNAVVNQIRIYNPQLADLLLDEETSLQDKKEGVAGYFKLRIEAEINKVLKENPLVSPPAPAPVLTELEAKKADIEKTTGTSVEGWLEEVFSAMQFRLIHPSSSESKIRLENTYKNKEEFINRIGEELSPMLSDETKNRLIPNFRDKYPELVSDLSKGTAKTTFYTDLANSLLNLVDLSKVDAKYNAELVALEGKPIEEVPPPPEEPYSNPGDMGPEGSLYSIARGNVDPDIREKYFKSGEVTTDRKILNKIAQSNHPLNAVARHLMKYAKGTEIKLIRSEGVSVTINGKQDLAAAVSYPTHIEIAEFTKFRGLGSEPTIIHEVIHSFTQQFLEVTGKDTKLYKEFERLYNESKSKIGKDMYALTNIHEFIVGLFSDVALIKELQQVKSSKPTTFRNLMHEIFDHILSLFGFKREGSLYEDAFAVATNIVEEAFAIEEYFETLPRFDAIPGLSEREAAQFVDDMTIRAAQIIFGGEDKMALFDVDKLSSNQIFDRIKEVYSSEREKKYQALGEKKWQALVERTKDKLRTIGIRFNDDNITDINEENANNRDYSPDPFSTDWKTYSPFAVKIVMSTLYKRKAGSWNSADLNPPPAELSAPVRGYISLNFNQAFATVMTKLSNTTDIAQMEGKLMELMENDPNYISLFARLGGKWKDRTFDFSEFGYEEWRLFINFFQTFSKQKPEAVVQYISGNNSYTRKADVFTASEELKRRWVQELKIMSAAPGSPIIWNSSTKTYRFNNKSDKFPSSAPNDSSSAISFLNNMGLPFTQETFNRLNDEKGPRGRVSDREMFFKNVSSLYTYLKEVDNLVTLTDKSLGTGGSMNKIVELIVKVNNPNQESTRFNLEGNRTQNFAENNTASLFENEFNSSNNVDELKDKRPELKDSYTKNSVVLKKGGIFFDDDGESTGRVIKVGVIEGKDDADSNKGTTISKVSFGDRGVIEINQNLIGNYSILNPSDASTGWIMSMGNHISFESIVSGELGWNKVFKVFNGYLEDDIALALDWRNRSKLKAISEARAKELRIFKDILSDVDERNILVPSKVLIGLNDLIEKDATLDDINEYVNNNISTINDYIRKFIEEKIQKTINTLKETRKVTLISKKGEAEVYSFKHLDDDFAKSSHINKLNLSPDQLESIIKFADINYIINNIEFHKILFGDPYQFEDDEEGRSTELKRVKSFLSPRKVTFDSPSLNNWLDREYNTVEGIPLDEEELGYHSYKPFIRTITLKEVMLETSLYKRVKEADGVSFIMDGTYKEMRLKNGQWSPEAEKWHQWQMAYTRQHIPGYQYKSEQLKKHDESLLKTPEPEHTIEILKPIVSGNKGNIGNMDIVLDKFAQMPLYYKAIEGTNLGWLYEKMWREKIGYAVMESGRKVGTTSAYQIYKNGNSLNEEPFTDIIDIPWKIYGIQVETMHDYAKEQTRGSQLTKLVSLDLFRDGEPIGDTPERKEVVQKAYDRNIEALRLLHENGYNTLLKKLGLQDLGNGYRVSDPVAIQKTLEYEMLKRELSGNARDTIKLNKDGQFPIPFEASTSYQQIKNILYSLVNKAVTSPKMHGGAKVQVPALLWENAKEGRGLIIKDGDRYKKITRDEYNRLSEEDKKKVRLSSDTLKFYTKEEPYCEIMIPNWIRDKFDKRKFPDDKSILKYLNSEEGRKILSGIGFRIPTQALASVEVFVVKGFLPAFMGDTVVVPSEIVAKAGSDFDIDKLNMYLKSVYVDDKGRVRLIKYMGDDTRSFFENMYEKRIGSRIKAIEDHREFRNTLVNNLDKEGFEDSDFFDYHIDIIQAINEQALEMGITSVQYLQEQIKRLDNEQYKLSIDLLDNTLKEDYVNTMYKRALENEYYESMEELIQLPENYERLLTPIGKAGLDEVAKELDTRMGINDSNLRNPILDRDYMTKLRHGFLSAKNWIGIAAVNLTGHSLMQKTWVYIDPDRINALPKFDRKLLGDGIIHLPSNSIDVEGKKFTSFSGDRNVDGDYISDRLSGYITAFVDVVKDPYIMKIITSDNVVNTFLMLERAGTGKNGVMFMSQPIIREYLTYLRNKGVKGLFGKTNMDFIRSQFGGSAVTKVDFNVDNFTQNIEDYYKNKTLTDQQKGEQLAIFDEFIKYAKMAEYLSRVTQATNYDTTKFRGSESFSKKMTRTDIAEDKNIFTGTLSMLDNSFIGYQTDVLTDLFDAMGSIIKTEQERFRKITEPILEAYGKDEFMSGDNFEKTASKLKSSFLDYIIHRGLGLNRDRIRELLIDPKTSVATQLKNARQRHPEVAILNELTIDSSTRGDETTSTKTIRLAINVKNPYDENMFIGMMRELKAIEPELYDNIVTISILQGIYQSPISIRNIIPIEDYSAKIKPIIDTLTVTPDLDSFRETGWFQRNNFKDPIIVPKVQPRAFVSSTYFAGEYEMSDYNIPAFTNGETVVKILKVPVNTPYRSKQLLLLSEEYDSTAVKYDFVKVPRMMVDKNTGEKIDIISGQTVTNQMVAEKLSKGDFSYYDVFGYKKVKYSNGEPVITIKGEHVYKLVNLYGDGYLASEYYDATVPSELKNGTIKVPKELDDNLIISYFGGQVQDNLPEGGEFTGVKKVIAGGQHGGDLGGLRGAKRAGIETGGTAPPGFVQHGRGNQKELLESFGLIEGEADPYTYPKRTMKNVDNSNGTVAFLWGSSAGTEKTIGYAQTHKWQSAKDSKDDGYKPVLVITSKNKDEAISQIKDFIQRNKIETLNVAGHRETSQPGIERFVEEVIYEALGGEKLEVAKAQRAEQAPDIKTTVVGVVDNIYNQLGNKTQSENIVIVNLKTKDGKYDRDSNLKEARNKGRIYSMETSSDLSFSNPWAHFNRTGTIKTNTTQEAVKNYIDWLTTDKFKDIKPERREWILNILKSGKLKNRPIQYYVELGEPSHATALDYLINKYDWMGAPQEVREQLREYTPEEIAEEKTFEQYGTIYRFVLKNNIPVEGYYTQRGKEERSLATENIQKKYEELSKETSILSPPSLSSMLTDILDIRSSAIDYTSGQRNALLDIQDKINQNKQGYYLLAGYAGTGKTTIIENIIKYAKQLGKDAVVMAPTNKAVKVVNEKLKMSGTRAETSTIHRAIYGEPDPLTGEWVPKKRMTNSVIVIDESSMINKELMKDLLDNTVGNNVLIFMGDKFQLEQIGDDSGLFKLFTSPDIMKKSYDKEFTDASELTEVKRQTLDSGVLKVATLVRTDNKAYIPSKSMDRFIIPTSRAQFLDDYRNAIGNNEDVVMIVATNNARINANKIARAKKFGPDKAILEKGETLISVANSSSYSNSETFNVADIQGDPEKYELSFEFDGKTVNYNMYLSHIIDGDGNYGKVMFFPGLDRPSLYHSQVLDAIRNSNPELYDSLDNDEDIIHTKKGRLKLSPNIIIATYGYAITAHKSQGSQWDKVFVDQDYKASSWNGARWWYTAITRSSNQVEAIPTSYHTKIDPAQVEERISNMVVPDIAPVNESQGDIQTGEEISKFYNGLSNDQKSKLKELGYESAEKLQEEFDNAPFIYDVYNEQDFIDNVRCWL